MMTNSIFTRLGGTAVLALALAACSKDDAASGNARKRPPQLVAAQTVVLEDYAPTLSALGTVTPSQSVAVRPRADGEIVGIAFKEGDNVRAGQLLFRLDARAASAQLQQARAQLAQAIASEAQARADFDRAQALVGKGFVAATVLDQRRAAAAGARAQIDAARASVKAAETQLSFLSITAPISGRTGELGFRLGANVRGGDATALVTINQLSPIHVRFLVPAEQVQAARAVLAAGGGKVVAKSRDGDGAKPLATGRLVFLDNNVDPGNGGVAARAEFRNDADVLWPGGVVTVELPLAAPTPRAALPESAVQTGRDMPFVWTVAAAKPGAAPAGPGDGKGGAGGKVEMRPVVVAGRMDGKVYLASGVEPGEQVVIDALARLRPGDMVRLKGPGKPTPPGEGAPSRTAG